MGVIGSMVGIRFVQEGHSPVLMARHVDKSVIDPIEGQVDVELGDVLDFPRILSIIQSYRITHLIHMADLAFSPLYSQGCNRKLCRNPPEIFPRINIRRIKYENDLRAS